MGLVMGKLCIFTNYDPTNEIPEFLLQSIWRNYNSFWSDPTPHPNLQFLKFAYQFRNQWLIGWHDIEKSRSRRFELFIININKFSRIYCSKVITPCFHVNTYLLFYTHKRAHWFYIQQNSGKKKGPDLFSIIWYKVFNTLMPIVVNINTRTVWRKTI